MPATLRIEDAFTFFVGDWDLERSIEDRRSLACGTFTGTASLTIRWYTSANNVNFQVCNLTSSSITPGTVTLNWRVTR